MANETELAYIGTGESGLAYVCTGESGLAYIGTGESGLGSGDTETANSAITYPWAFVLTQGPPIDVCIVCNTTQVTHQFVYIYPKEYGAFQAFYFQENTVTSDLYKH